MNLVPNSLAQENKESVHIISLGAGVQSSTMALMAAAGEITPMPIAAIFADTQAEPKSVYTWLDWLSSRLPFPVQKVTAGNLTKVSTMPKISSKSGEAYLPSSIPAFVRNTEGSIGTVLRQCTDKHKLAPLRKAIYKLSEYSVVWIGISRDEIYRMKPSKLSRIQHRWPLVDLGLSRHDCLEWMKRRGFPKPPRSACTFCPYHSSEEWRRLKTDEPLDFANAVTYERLLQDAFKMTKRLTGTPYLHRTCKPLSEVDFSTEEDRGQLNMFNNECEGMCGV